MSTRRILSRNRWRSAEEKPATYHEWAIAAGLRHPTFQSRVRKARIGLGLPPTSSNMATIHGQRVAR